MPGVVRPHRELRRNGERSGARNFLERLQHRLHIFLRVQRQRLLVLAVSAALGFLGVFFLQVRGIGKQNVAQLDGGRVGINRAAIAVADQPRQVSRMVQVRVRQHAPVKRRRFLRQRIPIAQPQLL